MLAPRASSHASASTSGHRPAPANAAAGAPPHHLPLPLRAEAGSRKLRRLAAAAALGRDNMGGEQDFVNRLNRHNLRGPVQGGGEAAEAPQDKQGVGYDFMGEDGYRNYVEGRKAERQRGARCGLAWWACMHACMRTRTHARAGGWVPAWPVWPACMHARMPAQSFSTV